MDRPQTLHQHLPYSRARLHFAPKHGHVPSPSSALSRTTPSIGSRRDGSGVGWCTSWSLTKVPRGGYSTETAEMGHFFGRSCSPQMVQGVMGAHGLPTVRGRDDATSPYQGLASPHPLHCRLRGRRETFYPFQCLPSRIPSDRACSAADRRPARLTCQIRSR